MSPGNDTKIKKNILIALWPYLVGVHKIKSITVFKNVNDSNKGVKKTKKKTSVSYKPWLYIEISFIHGDCA